MEEVSRGKAVGFPHAMREQLMCGVAEAVKIVLREELAGAFGTSRN